MKIVEIWRYPVKSMQGERLDHATIGQAGIIGDRAWSLVDLETGLSLTARRIPELLFAQATVASDETGQDQVIVTLPDGTETQDNEKLSAWLGRSVELRRAEASSKGTYETTLTEDESGEWVEWSGPEGSFHDSTRTRVSLACLSSFRDWDRRRFRINVLLDGEQEATLVGQQVSLGSSMLDVVKQVERCVVTTRPQPKLGSQDPLDRDLSVLKTINNELDGNLGVGSLVVTAGHISIGDELVVG